MKLLNTVFLNKSSIYNYIIYIRLIYVLLRCIFGLPIIEPHSFRCVSNIPYILSKTRLKDNIM